MTTSHVLAALGAYLLGSMPWAQWLVRWTTRRDLSRSGSSNVGALNAMRVTRSPLLGIGVLVLDLCKGAAAVVLARQLDVHPGIGLVAVVAGHNYSAWLLASQRRFAGGKGFAAAAGALLVTMPWLVAVWFAVGLVAWGLFRLGRGITDEAPASLVATLAVPPAAAILYDVPGTIAMGLVTLLILPKLVGEVRGLLRAT